MRTPAGYPPARARTGAPQPQLAEVYGRVESTHVETTLGDTDAVIYNFSGTPALIRLHARTNGALFTLTDRLNRETHEVAVLPNSTVDVRIPRDRVIARNLAAGSNASVYVEGYYAAQAERVHAISALAPGQDPPNEVDPVIVPPPDRGDVFNRPSSPCTRGFRIRSPYA